MTVLSIENCRRLLEERRQLQKMLGAIIDFLVNKPSNYPAPGFMFELGHLQTADRMICSALAKFPAEAVAAAKEGLQ